jgi:hypothetical protein
VRRTLGLGLLAMLFVLELSACGGGEMEAKARPLPEDRDALQSGEYRSEEFEPSFSFRVGKGWENDPPEAFDILLLTWGEKLGLGFLNVQRIYEPSKSGMPIVAHAPKNLVGWLQHHPYLQTSDPKPVTVGGVKGVQLDVAVAKDLPEDYQSGVCSSIADPEACVDLFRLSTHHSPVFVSERGMLRLIVLKDVSGQAVTTIEFGKLESAEAQKVLNSVEWRGSK